MTPLTFATAGALTLLAAAAAAAFPFWNFFVSAFLSQFGDGRETTRPRTVTPIPPPRPRRTTASREGTGGQQAQEPRVRGGKRQ